MTTGYVFDNAATDPARTRMTCLETLYDQVSQANLRAAGVASGWRALEVGAGGGSIARWLASQGARVTATDLNPSLCDPGPGVKLLRHDITTDPVDGLFDLIHTRLVLFHLPTRHQVLTKLAAALMPGGWLVIEDFDNTLIPYPPAGVAGGLISAYNRALAAVFTSRGADPGYARNLPAMLTAEGLTGIHTEGHVVFSRGGDTGAVLQRANVEQTRDLLTATGLISEPETRRLCQALSDPAVTFLQPVMIATRGQVTGV